MRARTLCKLPFRTRVTSEGDRSVSKPSRIPAVLAYLLPVIGWLFVLIFQRQNKLAVYHLRQSISLFLTLAVTLLGWIVVGWILAWIPYVAVISVALFAIVVAAYLFGVVAWILGMVNAARSRTVPLPLFGGFANRLPIK